MAFRAKQDAKLAASQARVQARASQPNKHNISDGNQPRRHAQAAESYHPDELNNIPKGDAQTAAESAAITSALAHHFLFAKLEDALVAKVVSSMKKSTFGQGEAILTEGAKGDEFVVLEEGKVSVSVKGQQVATLTGPVAFGELALMYNSPRNATVVVASRVAKCWMLDRRVFRLALASHAKEKRAGLEGFVKKVPLFSKLDVMQMARVAAALHPREYADKDTIIREGQPGSHFYVVEKGDVKVLVNDAGGNPQQVAMLKPGDFFGEHALLTHETRNATCVSVGPTTVLELGREDFEKLLGSKLKDILAATDAKRNQVDKATAAKGNASAGAPRKKEIVIKSSLRELRVDRTIGQGTFGRVKLVTHAASGRHMAMKCMSKDQIVKQKQVTNVMNETQSLGLMDHPFVLTQYGTWQDRDQLYIFTELLQGGELWSLIYQSEALPRTRFGGFAQNTARMYAACVIEALRYIHSVGYAYRDLKPENLMIDTTPGQSGYLKIVDFGFAKKIPAGTQTHTLCGTPEYLSPELVLSQGHDKSVDYWAFGVLCYELLVQRTPFADPDQNKIFQNIVRSKRMMPHLFQRGFPEQGRKIVEALLVENAQLRLGSGHSGAEEILSHRWFTGINWNYMRRKKYKTPYQPKISGPKDVSYADQCDEVEPRRYAGRQDLFKDF